MVVTCGCHRSAAGVGMVSRHEEALGLLWLGDGAGVFGELRDEELAGCVYLGGGDLGMDRPGVHARERSYDSDARGNDAKKVPRLARSGLERRVRSAHARSHLIPVPEKSRRTSDYMSLCCRLFRFVRND